MLRKKYGFVFLLWLCTGLMIFAGCTTIQEPLKVASSTPTVHSQGLVALPDFTGLVEKVKPSVVAITTEKVTYDSLNRSQTQLGSGSGWVISRDGTIVTNNHVIEGATSIVVEFCNHTAYSARLVQTDPTTDVAVLKIIEEGTFPPLTLADTSQLRVGQWVMILGNPLGLGISVKQGIISRLGVTVSSSPDQIYYNLIETSAAVNPGNSGGPMVNVNGEVIGITSLKIDASGIEGMGYAITIGDVVPVIEVLRLGSKVVRPWLGASLATVDQGVKAVYRLEVDRGALITEIAGGGPADKAGMQMGDVIVGFDGSAINNADNLNRLINMSRIGQEARVDFWRGNEKRSVDIVLTERPAGGTGAWLVP